jgi:hypothetical protein
LQSGSFSWQASMRKSILLEAFWVSIDVLPFRVFSLYYNISLYTQTLRKIMYKLFNRASFEQKVTCLQTSNENYQANLNTDIDHEVFCLFTGVPIVFSSLLAMTIWIKRFR